MKATGFISAKGPLNTITWKLVSADERSLGRTGHGLDRHIKHQTEAAETALGAWRSDVAARLN